MTKGIDRTILIVLDSLGTGPLPDADFSERDCNTLAHVHDSREEGLYIPNLEKMGIGNLVFMRTVERPNDTSGFYGKVNFRSTGKDSISGHLEMAGLTYVDVFSASFEKLPDELLEKIKEKTQLEFIVSSKEETEAAIYEYADEHKKSGNPILHVTEDSSLLLIAHEEKIEIEKQNEICKSILPLASEYKFASITSLPFSGTQEEYKISKNRKIFPSISTKNTLLHHLIEKEIPVYAVGKIQQIFSPKTITEFKPAENNIEAIEKIIEFIVKGVRNEAGYSFIFANLSEFDDHAHKRNPENYATALENFDILLPKIFRSMGERDILIITSDHGNDPTFSGSGHTREYAPLLVYSPLLKPKGHGDLGVRKTASDIAQTISDIYDLQTSYSAESFWDELVVLV